MFVLGIESSCDDTSVALLECSERGFSILSEKTASQIEIHQKYGGVVPEIAGRMHAEKIVPLLETVLAGQPKPEAIAVTAGPGLVTGLIVGVTAAATLSYATGIPIVRTNHIAGHIHSVELQEKGAEKSKKQIQFPALALVVSGGHTELVHMLSHTDYEMVGATKDDAAGECFDKVAKLLGLPYPGGPEISRLASTGRPDAINFPRPMLDQDNFDFSFAGLKTAALYWLRENRSGLDSQPDFCASVEQAIVDVLVEKTIKAAEKVHPKTIILAGGVAANKKLRETLGKKIHNFLPTSSFLLPALSYAMDNAAMIAAAGYYLAERGNFTDWRDVRVDPNWKIA